jgi:hypothetical protein
MLCEAHKPREEEEEADERRMQSPKQICAKQPSFKFSNTSGTSFLLIK